MRKFLFATDGSESSTKAAKTAETFLCNFPDCQLIVLHVIKPAYAADGMGFGVVPP